MRRTEGSFTTADQIKIFTLNWLPDAAPKAVIIIVHGLAEHAGRYEQVAEVLAGAGYAVYALDHQGHGRSGGWLRTHFKGGLDDAVRDLKQFFETIRATHPDLPVFFYGHSMGSLISLLFVLDHQADVTGWITSGSPLHTSKLAAGILVSIVKMIGGIAPTVRLIRLAGGGISSDPAEVEAYENDPLIDRKPMRVGMVSQIFIHAEAASKRLDTLTLPMLILHGSGDPVAPASGSQFLYDRASSGDKTLHIYPGYLHEVHHEKDKERVFADILDWLSQQVGTPAS